MIRFCAFFLLCCLFAPGAMPCVNITDKVQGICPFFNQTVEGYLPEIDRHRVIFHFGPLFRTRCSPLTKIFICSSLFPLCLPSGVLLPCRDVCFSVYTSCHHIFLLHDFEWPEYLDCNKLPARPRLCLSPTSPTPLFSVPSAFSVQSTSSAPSAPASSSPAPSALSSSFPSALSAPSALSSSAPSAPSSSSPSGLSAPSAPSSSSLSASWYYGFIVLGPLLCGILGVSFKSTFCCKQSAPGQEHAVRFTENSVSFSSPLEIPSLPQDQPSPQSASVPPDHPPPPPLPPKEKHWKTIYVNTSDTTLYATADLY